MAFSWNLMDIYLSSLLQILSFHFLYFPFNYMSFLSLNYFFVFFIYFTVFIFWELIFWKELYTSFEDMLSLFNRSLTLFFIGEWIENEDWLRGSQRPDDKTLSTFPSLFHSLVFDGKFHVFLFHLLTGFMLFLSVVFPSVKYSHMMESFYLQHRFFFSNSLSLSSSQ